jgi:hypothetical protein
MAMARLHGIVVYLNILTVAVLTGVMVAGDYTTPLRGRHGYVSAIMCSVFEISSRFFMTGDTWNPEGKPESTITFHSQHTWNEHAT